VRRGNSGGQQTGEVPARLYLRRNSTIKSNYPNTLQTTACNKLLAGSYHYCNGYV